MALRATLMLVATLLVLFPSSTSPPLANVQKSQLGWSGVLLAHAKGKLQECTDLKDLFSYGVNRKLFQSGGPYYLSSQYFCAKSAPEQYHCKCSTSTRCHEKADPWGRDIGVCGCCAAWIYACAVLIALAFVIVMVITVYGLWCHRRWWCDGYVPLVATLMPRRGAAVSCPPDRRLPNNVFRGYPSSAFVNVDQETNQVDNEAEVAEEQRRRNLASEDDVEERNAAAFAAGRN